MTNTFTFFHIKKSANKVKYSQSWASQVVTVVKKSPANAGDTRDVGSIPGCGRFPGEGNGKPLQYSCLENSMDREARQAAVHAVAHRQTQLSDYVFCSVHVNYFIHTFIYSFLQQIFIEHL